MTEMLTAERVEPLLQGRFGRPYRHRLSCPSTQLLLERDDPEGAVAVAEEQTSGRGRLGRSWEAPAGHALLVSILLRPPDMRAAPQLSLVGGLAVARVVEHELHRAVGVKWPNDVVVEGHKVAGVLAEGRHGSVVLGIGMNVNQQPGQLPAAARTPAASLRSIDGRERDRAPLLALLLSELELAYETWLNDGLAGLHAELDGRDVLRGRETVVAGRQGIAEGIDAEGRLLLRGEGGVEAITSGEPSAA